MLLFSHICRNYIERRKDSGFDRMALPSKWTLQDTEHALQPQGDVHNCGIYTLTVSVRS